MSSDEEDYMSAGFLEKTEHVRPGMNLTFQQRRALRVEASRFAAREAQLSGPKRAVIEKERREEALATPVDSSSKGFALMAKMGFKPGMSLGKKKDEHDMGSGIKEPIGIEMKMNRKGLGHEADEEAKRKERCEAAMSRMKARAAMHTVLIGDFRKRKRVETTQKQLIGDILKSRKTCHELEMEVPEQPWYWPSYRESAAPSDTGRYPGPTRRRPPWEEEDEEEDDAVYRYSNGKLGPKEIRFEYLQDDELEDRLTIITEYLRTKHTYCVWCGCQYESDEQLLRECAGDTRAAHDDLDEHD